MNDEHRSNGKGMTFLPANIQMDENGFPVMFADVPGSGVSKVDPDTPSGNPRHDTRSGKFGTAPGKRKRELPPNVDPLEYARMLDAVRDAAREFEDWDEGDVREFLSGRAKAPDQVDIARFLQMVKEQQKTDVIDIFDQQLRSGPLRRGRRRVRVTAPRGYLRKIMGVMDDDAMAEIMHRLEARGHTREAVDKFFEGRIKEDSEARTKRDALQASRQWEGELVELEGDDWHYRDRAIDLISDDEDMIELAAKLMSKMPQPVVKVEPHIVVEAPKPIRREIIRDEKTGLAIGVQEIPDEEDDGSSD